MQAANRGAAAEALFVAWCALRGFEFAVAPPGMVGYDAVLKLDDEWRTVQIRALPERIRLDLRRGISRRNRTIAAELIAAVDLRNLEVLLLDAAKLTHYMVGKRGIERAAVGMERGIGANAD